MSEAISQVVVVTAAFSNAVFQATFPIHADFYQKLTGRSLTVGEIAKVRISDTYPHIASSLVLTNGEQFWISEGLVTTYIHPRDFFYRQWPEPIENYFGRIKMSSNEALNLASNTVIQFGYSFAQFTTNWSMATEGPITNQANVIPFIGFRWRPQDDEYGGAAINVDMENKRVVHFSLPYHIKGKIPKISIIPETMKAYRERIKKTNGVFTVPSKP